MANAAPTSRLRVVHAPFLGPSAVDENAKGNMYNWEMSASEYNLVNEGGAKVQRVYRKRDWRYLDVENLQFGLICFHLKICMYIR